MLQVEILNYPQLHESMERQTEVLYARFGSLNNRIQQDSVPHKAETVQTYKIECVSENRIFISENEMRRIGYFF